MNYLYGKEIQINAEKKYHSYYRKLSAVRILFEAQITEWTQNLSQDFYFSPWELGEKRGEKEDFSTAVEIMAARTENG